METCSGRAKRTGCVRTDRQLRHSLAIYLLVQGLKWWDRCPNEQGKTRQVAIVSESRPFHLVGCGQRARSSLARVRLPARGQGAYIMCVSARQGRGAPRGRGGGGLLLSHESKEQSAVLDITCTLASEALLLHVPSKERRGSLASSLGTAINRLGSGVVGEKPLGE